jgi:hypothetical protein
MLLIVVTKFQGHLSGTFEFEYIWIMLQNLEGPRIEGLGGGVWKGRNEDIGQVSWGGGYDQGLKWFYQKPRQKLFVQPYTLIWNYIMSNMQSNTIRGIQLGSLLTLMFFQLHVSAFSTRAIIKLIFK